MAHFVGARMMAVPKRFLCAGVVLAFLIAFPLAAVAATASFTPQTRVGFTSGDQWEPSIAADRNRHVYVLYPQYNVVPGCDSCPSPTMILVISNDNGKTWQPPAQIATPGSGQWDAQIAVDPLDGKTVYASWLQNNKSTVVVAKSTDFGLTWNTVVANSTNAGVDKDVLAVRGNDVYVGYNHSQKVWVSASHDGGATFTSAVVNPNGKLGWSLAGGATIDPAGNVYYSWAGYTQNGGAKGPVNLYISKSSDLGATWSLTLLDVSGAPFDCSAFGCGWAFLGAQITITSDSAGTLYALWNAGSADKAPERIYFSTSTTAGKTWSTRQDVSAAAPGVEHAFPAITAGLSGDVRIAWMDSRNTPLWNVYYRSSTDGGATWSSETRLSSYVPGYGYIQPNGFNFPFGDYFQMAIDSAGRTNACWGEGLNYDTPGSIWYTSGR
jgi:hypothetical protein